MRTRIPDERHIDAAIPHVSLDTPAVVVFASVADADCHSQLPRRAVALLANSGVRLVLVSASAATDVRRIQRRLHMTEPFVCDGGAAVHVPATGFWNREAPDDEDPGCEIFRFNPPDRAAAVNLVRDLFLAVGHDVVTIGIGRDLEDYGVLSAVDVPVVIRDPARDQRELLRHVPGAYLTNATGVDGWSEALIGP